MNWNNIFNKKAKAASFFLFLIVVLYNVFIKENFSENTVSFKEISKIEYGDIVLGKNKLNNKDIKIDNDHKFVLFFDFSCGHCGDFFREEFIKIKKIINDKNIDFIIRQAPNNIISMQIFNFIHCKERTNDEKIKIVEIVMHNINQIFKDKNYETRFIEILKQNNINTEDYHYCANNSLSSEKAQKKIKKIINDKIKTIPMLIYNNKLINIYNLEKTLIDIN